jgi:hypothetical protein
MYSSTCFGRPHAHHRELQQLQQQPLLLPLERGDSSAVGRGRACRPDHDHGDFYISRQSAHESGKVVSPTHRPRLPAENIFDTYFC